MEPKQDFTLWVKNRLWQRRMTVGQLAQQVGKHRSTVSTAIYHDRFPHTRKAIRRALA